MEKGIKKIEIIGKSSIPFNVSDMERRKLNIMLGKVDVKGIGRNDLCPCGSGKKYKKCCMRCQ